MSKKAQPRVGDVIMIPVSKDAFAAAKVLFLSRRYKSLMILGVATDRTYPEAKLPSPLPARWPFVLHTLSNLIENPASNHLGNGTWHLAGHDPAPVPEDASVRIVADQVLRGDEPIREATPADYKTVPVQGADGVMLAEWRVQDAVGVPRTPKPGAAAKGKAAPPQLDPAPTAPAALAEERFWSLIEDAWKSAPAAAKKRPGVAPKVTEADAEAVSEALSEKVVPALKKALAKLSRDEIIAFDRVLERKLYDIDRADVQAVTDGSDDGFLYARGYVVGVGRAYYDAVNADPKKAFTDMEEERITYLPDGVFEERFGERIPRSSISRESCSNAAGWPKTKKKT